MSSKKPRVLTKCVANAYTGPNERIIEFVFSDGPGGLISFFDTNEGPVVNVYRVDKNIKVHVSQEA